MNFVVEHPTGRREGPVPLVGDNLTLGLGGTLFACVCGKREFVDASSDLPPDERAPDHTCPGCGRKFWFYDAEDDHAGFLH